MLLYFRKSACIHNFLEEFLYTHLKTLNTETKSLSFWNKHWVRPWTTELLWNNHRTISYLQSHTTSNIITLQSINSTSLIIVKPRSSSKTSLTNNRNTTRLIRLIKHLIYQNPSLDTRFPQNTFTCIRSVQESNLCTNMSKVENRHATYQH